MQVSKKSRDVPSTLQGNGNKRSYRPQRPDPRKCVRLNALVLESGEVLLRFEMAGPSEGIDCTVRNDYVRRALAESGRSRTERPTKQRGRSVSLPLSTVTSRPGSTSNRLGPALRHLLPLSYTTPPPLPRKSSGQTES